MNSMAPLGRTSRITWAEFAAVDARNITPALANGFVFWMLPTRTTICASPAIGCVTAWKASAVPQMSEPAPRTVYTPLAYVALPPSPTVPMSWLVHGAGSDCANAPRAIDIATQAQIAHEDTRVPFPIVPTSTVKSVGVIR